LAERGGEKRKMKVNKRATENESWFKMEKRYKVKWRKKKKGGQRGRKGRRKH